MLVDIKVIAGARRNELKTTSQGTVIYLTAPAYEGRANKALINFLSGQYHVAKREIEIIKGLKSRLKTVRINIP